jgi:hypothetical protein
MHDKAPLSPPIVRQLAMLCVATDFPVLVHPTEQGVLPSTRENTALVFPQLLSEGTKRVIELMYLAQVIRHMGDAGLTCEYDTFFEVPGDDEIEAMLDFEVAKIAWRSHGQHMDTDSREFKTVHREAIQFYEFFRRRMGHRALRTVEAAHLLGAVQQKMGVDASGMLGRRLRTCAMPR